MTEPRAIAASHFQVPLWALPAAVLVVAVILVTLRLCVLAVGATLLAALAVGPVVALDAAWRLLEARARVGGSAPDKRRPEGESGLARPMLVAASSTILAIGLWPVIKGLAYAILGVALFIQESDTSFGNFRHFWIALRRGGINWAFHWRWEAWSIARWWLMFGMLTLVLRPRSARPRAGEEPGGSSGGLRRMLNFAPWLIALEIGFLVGTWVGRPHVAPEPGTIFRNESLRVTLQLAVWWTRGLVPSLVVGLAYFRKVLGWRWPASLAGACLLAPAAVALSACWSVYYPRSFILGG